MNFTRHIDKVNILKARKVKRNLSTKHLWLNTDSMTYMRECLTPGKNYLFKQARDYKKLNYKYAWTSEERIFIQKDNTSKVIPVDNKWRHL